MTAPWYWLLFTLAVLALAVEAWFAYITLKWTPRHNRLTAQRLDRLDEDYAWRFREWEAETALRLRRQRLARLKAANPDAFVTAVKLAQIDNKAADLLIAQVTA